MATRSERQHKTDQNGVHFHGTHLEHKLPRHTHLRKSSHGALPSPLLPPCPLALAKSLHSTSFVRLRRNGQFCMLFSMDSSEYVPVSVCAGVCVCLCFSVSDGHVCLLPQCVCFFFLLLCAQFPVFCCHRSHFLLLHF